MWEQSHLLLHDGDINTRRFWRKILVSAVLAGVVATGFGAYYYVQVSDNAPQAVTDIPSALADIDKKFEVMIEARFYETANALAQEALTLAANHYETTSPAYVRFAFKQALALTKLDQTANAISLYEKSLEVVESNPEKYFPGGTEALVALAGLYADSGELDKAEAILERAPSWQEYLAAHTLSQQRTRRSFGFIHQDLGNTDTAETIFNAAYKQVLRERGSRHRSTARAHWDLAEFYEKQDRFGEATMHWRSVVSYLKYKDDTLGVARYLHRLGENLLYQGKYEDAQRTMAEALPFAQSLHWNEHLDLASIYTTIATIHEALGETEEALEARNQALELEQSQKQE